MQTAVYTTEQFVQDAREIRKRRLDDQNMVAALTPLLERLVAQPD